MVGSCLPIAPCRPSEPTVGVKAGWVKKYLYRRSLQEKRAEKSRGGFGHHANIRISGGRSRFRTWQYGISSLIELKSNVPSLRGSLVDEVVDVASPPRLVSDRVGGAPVPMSLFCEGSCSDTASSGETGSWVRLTGRLLLTRIPTTCPKALTPLSVLPHFEYSQPSQLGSSGSSNVLGVGNTSRALFNAFHSSSSTVGKGVLLLGWNSRPL